MKTGNGYINKKINFQFIHTLFVNSIRSKQLQIAIQFYMTTTYELFTTEICVSLKSSRYLWKIRNIS